MLLKRAEESQLVEAVGIEQLETFLKASGLSWQNFVDLTRKDQFNWRNYSENFATDLQNIVERTGFAKAPHWMEPSDIKIIADNNSPSESEVDYALTLKGLKLVDPAKIDVTP